MRKMDLLKKLLPFSLLFCSMSALADNPSPAPDWRKPLDENLVYLNTDEGLVIIELAPFMAAKNVEQFKNLISEGFYDGLSFYRVIDGFVAQGGDPEQTKKSDNKSTLPAEFSRTIPANSKFIPVQSQDLMASETGYLHGFSAGRSVKDNQEWLLHCPGHVAMARTAVADSATTEFYIVIGQAPRHLDRNMSSLGRVIYGLEHVQSLQRANINNASGVIEDKSKRSRILWAKLATNVAQKDKVEIRVMRPEGPASEDRLSSAKTLDNDFYHFKGNGNLDLCYYQMKTKVVD